MRSLISMPPWRFCPFVALAWAVLVSAFGASADEPPSCRPPGSTVLRRSETLLVVKRKGGLTQACHRSTRRVRVLDRHFNLDDRFATQAYVHDISGKFVAY